MFLWEGVEVHISMLIALIYSESISVCLFNLFEKSTSFSEF